MSNAAKGVPLQSGQADFWRYDGKNLIRVHKRPRKGMFDPSTTKSQDCPIDHLKLKSRRVVKYTAQGEVREHLLVHENCHLPESKGSLPHLWIGVYV